MSIKKTKEKLAKIDDSMAKVFNWEHNHKRPDGKPQPVLASLAIQLSNQRTQEAQKIGRKKAR